MARRAKAEADPQRLQDAKRLFLRSALSLLAQVMRFQQARNDSTRETLWTRGGVVYVVSETFDAQGKLLRAVVVERYEIPMAWGEDLYGSHDGQGRWVEDQDEVVLEWEVKP